MAKFIGESGLIYLWNKIKAYVSSAISGKQNTIDSDHKLSADLIQDGDNNAAYTKAEQTKLSGVASGAEVNQNAFSNVKVGSTTVAADSKTDTLELVAGSNVTLTPDATNDKVTIAVTTGAIPGATSTTPKMDGTAAIGTETTWAKGDHVHPTDTSRQAAITSSNKLSADLIQDGTTNHVFTAADDTKLSNIETGAEVNVVKSVDTTAGTGGLNLSLDSNGKLDVTGTTGSIASGNSNFVTGGTVYSTTSTLAPKASPALTGTPTAPTATAGTNTTQIATTAFVATAVQNAQVGAATFQGTAPTSFAPTNYKKGYYWVVATAGTYAGQTCEAGDMIFCVSDYNTAYNASDFNVVQTNLDISEMSTGDMDTATSNWA